MNKPAVEFFHKVQEELAKNSCVKTKTSMEKYLKNIVECRGIKVPAVDKIFKNVFDLDTRIALSSFDKHDLGELFVMQKYHEDKLIAMNIYKSIHSIMSAKYMKTTVKHFFEDGHIKG